MAKIDANTVAIVAAQLTQTYVTAEIGYGTPLDRPMDQVFAAYEHFVEKLVAAGGEDTKPHTFTHA